jgi:hypothetical protein
MDGSGKFQTPELRRHRMSGSRPKSDLGSRLALGLAVLALVPGILARYGVNGRDLMALMAGTGTIVLVLFLDVLYALLRKTLDSLRSLPARLRTQRRSRVRFTREWHRAESARRRL